MTQAAQTALWQVYPRVCGGTTNLTVVSRYSAGLSPRVRGNREATLLRPRAGGSIPACAGEPNDYHAIRAVARVYPRVCGGTTITLRIAGIIPGLSPRVRGNRYAAVVNAGQERSIPACAGEPAVIIDFVLSTRVYPRVCGGTQ